MKHLFVQLCALIILFSLLTSKVFSQIAYNEINKDTPINQTGTISFILHTDQTYSNGFPDENFSQTLVNLPGLGKCMLERNYTAVSLSLQWQRDETHTGFYINLTDLPGPGKYSIIYTWDANKGLADGYFNGAPFRLENNKYYKPWTMSGSSTGFEIPEGPNTVHDVKIYDKYISGEEAVKLTPKDLYGKMTDIIFEKNLPAAIDITTRKGKLLYSAKMDNEESIKDWVLEGPGLISFKNNSMIMQSQIPNPPDGSTGHFNLWCPVDFPENIIIEWDFQPLTDFGVCHLFFAANGTNGEDIFDSSLPKRDGHYPQYHSGSINNYFVIYHSNLENMRTTNIATTWLMKSNKISLLSLGQIGVVPGNKEFHKMRLIKEGGHIQLQVNDLVYLDFTDPGNDRRGPVYGGGKISFRQMAVFIAAYKNFKVWEIL